MSKIAQKAKLNDTERVLRALPEGVTQEGRYCLLHILKQDDRFIVNYSDTAPWPDKFVFLHYEESTLFEAANKAIGKLEGFKE